MNQKIAIYTCIFGGYDTLKEDHSVEPPKGIDFFIITDNADIETSFYKPIVKPILFNSAQKTARYYKIMAHVVFKDYDHVFFHDGSIKIKLNMISELKALLGSADFIGYHHHIRKCAYAEATNCKRYAFEYSDIINRQIKKMKEIKFPKKTGLFETGFIYRNLSNPQIIDLNKTWWHEINEFSTRDQISLPYVLYRLGVDYKYLAGKLRMSPFFEFNQAHNVTRNIKIATTHQLLVYKLSLIYYFTIRNYVLKIHEKFNLVFFGKKPFNP